MKTELNAEICEMKYFMYKEELEDLLVTTFFGLCIILLIIRFGFDYLSILQCFKYTLYFVGVPYALKHFNGEIGFYCSIFGILLFLIEVVIFIALGSVITLLMFVHFTCQMSYYYRHYKKFEKDK